MITIGIVTYNRPEFLAECVDSILSQTYQDWQLIISNDYVPQEVTYETLGITADSRIKIINQKKNIGEISNLNFLLSLAFTKYFTWLCDDDKFHATFLEHALSTLEACEVNNLVAYYSGYRTGLTYQSNHTVEHANFLIKPNIYSPKKFIESYLLKKLQLIGCYGVINSKALKRIGGFKVLGNSFSPYSDALLPISLSELGNIAYTEAPLVFLRTHQSSMSSSSPDFQGYITAEDDFVKELTSIDNRSPGFINLQRCLGLACIWFSDNHFAVLMRGRSNSTLEIYLKYFKHELTVSMPRLNLFWKIRLLTHIILFCISNVLHSFERKIRYFLDQRTNILC
jgi:glycosyltransferase involved in cell wall biosynthesis